METATRRYSTYHYWNLVKDMDDSQKLQLIAMLAKSIKPNVALAEKQNNENLSPYTMQEIDDMLDEAEAAFEAGEYLTNDEVFHHHKDPLAVADDENSHGWN